MTEMPTRDRIMALLSPPSQDVYLDVEDARWIKAEIERLECHLAISKGKHTSAIEEIERLREALGKICSLLSPTTGYWIALKALEASIWRRDE